MHVQEAIVHRFLQGNARLRCSRIQTKAVEILTLRLCANIQRPHHQGAACGGAACCVGVVLLIAMLPCCHHQQAYASIDDVCKSAELLVDSMVLPPGEESDRSTEDWRALLASARAMLLPWLQVQRSVQNQQLPSR
eukprot:364904-Chlamydomonas_euryale.AAC.20